MTRKARRAAVPISDLVARVIGPVAAKRGFATADLIASWSEIAGPRLASFTRPERIAWPPRDPDSPGVLVLRIDGPAAILVQHEADQIVDRVNTFMGYRAVERLRIIQAPVTTGDKQPEPVVDAPLSELPEDVATELSEVDDDALRGALTRLGHGVFTRRR